jgi:hypothetical protein
MNPSAKTIILFNPKPDSDRDVLKERLKLLAADTQKTMPGYLREDQAVSDSGQWAVIAYFDGISAAREYKDVSSRSGMFPDLIRLVDTDSISVFVMELV